MYIQFQIINLFYHHLKLLNYIPMRARSTDRDKLTANQWFRHSDLVTDFVTVILSQSEGLGKMAL